MSNHTKDELADELRRLRQCYIETTQLLNATSSQLSTKEFMAYSGKLAEISELIRKVRAKLDGYDKNR